MLGWLQMCSLLRCLFAVDSPSFASF